MKKVSDDVDPIDPEYIASARRIHREAANILNDMQLLRARLDSLAFVLRGHSPDAVCDAIGGPMAALALLASAQALELENSEAADVLAEIYPRLQTVIHGKLEVATTGTVTSAAKMPLH